jgi:hypothetical protein
VTDQAAALARRDPSDSNTLVLAGLLAPVVIVAEDRDIVAGGLAFEQWRDLYGVAVTFHKGNTHVRGAAMATALTVYGFVGAGKAAIRAARNPWALTVAGLGALLLYTSAGSWAPRLHASWQRGTDIRREAATAVGEALTAAALRVRQAEATWRSAERGKPGGGTLLHQLARVLAVTEAPMTRPELVTALDLPEHRAAMANVASLLLGHRAFHEVHRAGGNSAARRSTSAPRGASGDCAAGQRCAATVFRTVRSAQPQQRHPPPSQPSHGASMNMKAVCSPCHRTRSSRITPVRTGPHPEPARRPDGARVLPVCSLVGGQQARTGPYTLAPIRTRWQVP